MPRAEFASAKHCALLVDASSLEAHSSGELVAAGFAGPQVPDLALVHVLGNGRRQDDIVAVRAAR